MFECKPPHTLFTNLIEAGLEHLKGVSVETVIGYPTDVVFEKYSGQVVAAAITQAYHYMVFSGIEYGCVYAGEVIIFLWIYF